MWPNRQETAIWLHLLNKSLMGNLIFCAVYIWQIVCEGKENFIAINSKTFMRYPYSFFEHFYLVESLYNASSIFLKHLFG